MSPVCYRNWSLLIEVRDGYLLAATPFTFEIVKKKLKRTLDIGASVTACPLILIRAVKCVCTVFALHRSAWPRENKGTECQPPCLTTL